MLLEFAEQAAVSYGPRHGTLHRKPPPGFGQLKSLPGLFLERASLLRCLERLVDVALDILHPFQTDREAHVIGRDSRRRLLLGV